MIHPSAIVDPGAELGESVEIGPYSIIGPDVVIGTGCRIGPHVVIEGPTSIGCDNVIHAFAALGGAPQDKKYADEPTRLEIGDGNTIREYVTMNRGTVQGGGVTRVGHDNWIMAYAHVAHDCVVGDHTIFANAASIAGHVTVGDYAILGGFVNSHQFVHIGAHSFSALGTTILQDIPPYVTVSGVPAAPHGINREGLKRRGFGPEEIRAIHKAYKLLYKSGLRRDEALAQIRELAETFASLQGFVQFVEHSERGIVR